MPQTSLVRRYLLGAALACLAFHASPVARGEPAYRPSALRLAVRGTQLVRIPKAALEKLAPTWPTGSDADLRVTRERGWGTPAAAVCPPGGDGAAGTVPSGRAPDGSFLFLAEADGKRDTVYDIRPVTGAAHPFPTDVWLPQSADPRIETFTWEDQRVFGHVASGSPEIYAAEGIGHWYLAELVHQGTVEIPISLPEPGPVAGSTLRFEVTIVGTHAGEAKVAAKWGDLDLGTALAPKVAGRARLSFTGSAKQAPAAGSLVPLVLHDLTPTVTPSGDSHDTSEGVGSIWVERVDLTAPMKASPGPYIAHGERTVRVGEIDGASRLVPVMDPPDPVAAAHGAEMLILSTRTLLPGARRLAEHRSKTGLATVAVPVADVWDALAGGHGGTDVLEAYLDKVLSETPSPRFVLLCGDATWDRTDLSTAEALPTAYVRTLYNGATASDRALVKKEGRATPAMGRLPFRDAGTMDAYVDRVIRQETRPSVDDSRRTLRFITSEGRFGTEIDQRIENLFVDILETWIPRPFDLTVTFARVDSPFGWPAREFNEKVLSELNAGSLFFTYVGHGWAHGFDDLRVEQVRYPILRSENASQVSIQGTLPAVFVIACTTARFDVPNDSCVGEVLLARAKGPIAYCGATRVCHPAWNSIFGRQIAIEMFKDGKRRLGEILEAAVSIAEGPIPAGDLKRSVIEIGAQWMMRGTNVGLARIKTEGAAMYVTLGDPAIQIPFPQSDLAVEAERTEQGVRIRVKGPFPDGTDVSGAVEVSRDVTLVEPPPDQITAQKRSPEEAMRRRHDRSNDKSLGRGSAKAAGGVATFDVVVPKEWLAGVLHAKVRAVYGTDVHQGAVKVAGP